MAQYDVYANPVRRARRVYPYVVVLQADLAGDNAERIVAPLAPKAQTVGSRGRLMPHVSVADVAHVVFVQSMTAVLASDLRETRGHLGRYRGDITAALDYLFLGA